MNKIKFGILSGLMTSVLVVVPSFAADLTALQGSTLDLSGTTSSDVLIKFVDKGVDFSQTGSSFYINTDGNLKLQAATGKSVVVDHNNLAFSGNDTYVSKFGDPKIDFNRGGSIITAEGDSLNMESDGTVKLIGDAVRVDHNYLKFVNDGRYPIPTIDFVKEGAKITAEDGVRIEGDKGLQIDGPIKVTGAQTYNGNQTVTGNLVVTGTSDLQGAITTAGNFAQSGATTFGTGTGAVSLKGDVTVFTDKNFTQNGAGQFTTGSGANTLNGNVVIAAGKGITSNGGAGALDFSGASGVFKTTTGAVTLEGDTTISGAKTFTTGTGAVTLKGSTSLDTGKTLTLTDASLRMGAGGIVFTAAATNSGTCVKGSVNANTTDGILYICSATDTWTKVGVQV